MTYGNYPDLRGVKRVLVVKLRHHGDVLLSSPVFSNLKKNLPNASIDALIYKETLPMLEGHPAISQFLLYDSSIKKLPLFKKIYKELLLLKEVRKKGYDLVVNLTEGDRGAIIALASGAKVKVGVDPGDNGFYRKKKIYTHLVKNCSTPRHTVEKNLDALRRIGIFPAPEERDLTLTLPEIALNRVQNLLFSEGLKGQDYVVIHPVSRWRFKCVPPAQVSQLIRELASKGEKVILTAGPDLQERKMIEEILSYIPGIPVINLAGQMTLKELSALISLSKCLICVDSVPLHIASALKAPVVAIFGPTSEQNWGPWMNPQSRLVVKRVSCRPCFLDGCGGSKKSDCLSTLDIRVVVDAFHNVKRGLKEQQLPVSSASLQTL